MSLSPGRGDERGFTLIELLAVIAILGVLGAVVVFAFGNSTRRAQVVACRMEYREITVGLETFRAHTGSFPTQAQGLAALASGTYKTLDHVPDPATWSYDGDKVDVIGTGRCSSFVVPTSP